MKNLDEKKWGAVRLTDVFDDTISRGKRIKKKDHISGKTPYVSSTASSNGNDGTCGNDINVRKFSDCLTLANSGSVGACFYHPYRFVASDHVTALKRNGMDKNGYLALSVLCGRIGEKYNFNREINDLRISKERIVVPVDEYNMPDYAYMSDYVSHFRTARLKQYNTYAKLKISLLGEVIDIPLLCEKAWSPFLISDIFDIRPGKRLVAADSTPGQRPFIGAMDNNNGIARFVSDENASLDRNVLGVNYNGGMVIGFYHPYECIFSDDVKRFHLKDYEDNAYILLFMKVAILQQKSKFGYLYKFNATRMANTRIMLPTTFEGTPDYEYMEQYAKNMMLRKYKQYLAYQKAKEAESTGAKTE